MGSALVKTTLRGLSSSATVLVAGSTVTWVSAPPGPVVIPIFSGAPNSGNVTVVGTGSAADAVCTTTPPISMVPSTAAATPITCRFIFELPPK